MFPKLEYLLKSHMKLDATLDSARASGRSYKRLPPALRIPSPKQKTSRWPT